MHRRAPSFSGDLKCPARSAPFPRISRRDGQSGNFSLPLIRSVRIKVRQAEKRKAAEQARKEQETAKARALYLDRLAERRDAAWIDVLHLRLDLRDLAARDHEDVKFKSPLRQIQEIHSTNKSPQPDRGR
jgi:hypothetical protein